MVTQADNPEGSGGSLPMRFWLIGAAVIAALALVYWFAIRTTYQPILTNLEPQDAASIVKVLDERKIPYELADEGHTVLVDSAVADKAKVELVGSDLPLQGQVGFELFNKSDMGLTEFDQKINYQRALQGELARTILMLDGVKAVRVHLGLPEQNLFRSEQQQPKASVTIALKPGTSLTEQRVQGIQRIVSGAVPDMPTDAVAVLDGSGRIISAVPQPADQLIPADRSLEAYRARLDELLHRTYPDMPFALVVTQRTGPAAGIDHANPPDGESDDHADKSLHGYAIRLTTPKPLDPPLREALLHVLADGGFDPQRGDTVSLLVGPAIAPAPPPVSVALGHDRIVSRGAPMPEPDRTWAWVSYWPFAVALALLALAVAFVSDRIRARRQTSRGLLEFADELRVRLQRESGLS